MDDHEPIVPLEDLKDPGALIDTRTDAEKARDYRFGEIVSAVEPVIWKEKTPAQWRKFPIFNQNGSGSCVAQTLRKMYGVYIWLQTGVWVDISASHIYQRRSNRPGAGMGGTDVFMIGQKGTTLNLFAPSDNMTDGQMDAVDVIPFMQSIGETFKLGSYIVVSPTDIDTIASIIQQTGKAVMVWFYFRNDEWLDTPVVKYPNLDLYAQSTARHSVAAVDFALVNGKKSLIISDSWGLAHAMQGQRVITEDFFDKRNFFAAHFMNFAFENGVSMRPKYDGKTIISLQRCLRYEGFFPTNIDFTENLGPITKTAVNKFQVKYGLHPTGTGTVGPLTKAKLLQLYP